MMDAMYDGSGNVITANCPKLTFEAYAVQKLKDGTTNITPEEAWSLITTP